MRAPFSPTAFAVLALACGSPATPRIVATPLSSDVEIGRAVEPGEGEAHIAIFDTLDFEVFSHQQWQRLGESHAPDIVVSWPDGHDTHGLEQHTHDLMAMFVYAPDTAIRAHPVRIAHGEWTAVTGVMTGTFTEPMPGPDGTTIPPTGQSFILPMATIGHWTQGHMDHEWLYWDNASYRSQLGL